MHFLRGANRANNQNSKWVAYLALITTDDGQRMTEVWDPSLRSLSVRFVESPTLQSIPGDNQTLNQSRRDFDSYRLFDSRIRGSGRPGSIAGCGVYGGGTSLGPRLALVSSGPGGNLILNT